MKLIFGTVLMIGLLISLHLVAAKPSIKDALSSTFSDIFIKNAVPQASAHVPLAKEHAKLASRSDVTQLGRVAPSARHQVVFACKQANLGQLEEFVNDVSDPASGNFGKHLSKAEVSALTANPVSSQHILRFLEHHGAKTLRRTANDEYITAEAPVATWETLLQTEFFHFTVQGEKKATSVVRSLKYPLPEALASHVSAVFNVVDFPDVYFPRLVHDKQPLQEELVHPPGRKSVSAADEAPTCLGRTGYTCPALLNYVYDMRSNTGLNLTSQAIFASIEQTLSPSDLSAFQQRFGLPVDGIANDIGGHVDDAACSANVDDCMEANLDVQYIMAVSQNVPTTYYYIDLYSANGWLDWITQVADMADPHKVFSISYVSGEEYITQSVADSFNTEAMKLAAMGVTIMSASGDDGAPGMKARTNGLNCGYMPQFPASCPYLTAVGGTQGPESNREEIACQSQLGGVITTGGGFSQLYPRSSWQNDQVTVYLDGVAGTSESPSFGYNAQGRGYPDVSLMAFNYLVVTDNYWSFPSGTSASCPINEQRVAAGKSTLGWINPSLYSLSSSILLNDITSGHNKCVCGGKICCAQGFYARPGWDPVTGVGSVNFTAMSESFFKLGDEPNVPSLAPTAVSSLSSMPVAAPSVAPSLVANAVPTNTAGWLYVNTYTGENCEGTNIQVKGQPTGTCMLTCNEYKVVTGSRMYSCGAEYGTQTYYSSGNYDPNTVITTGSVYLGCTVQSFAATDDYYAVRESHTFLCSNNKDTLYPIYGGDFAVNSSYDATTCGGEATHFSALKNNFCIAGSATSSYLITFPDISFYVDSADCSTEAAEVETTSTDCEVNENLGQDDGDDDTYGTVTLSYRVTLYTGNSDAPSTRPSAAPSVNDLVYFSASQIIHGVDVTTFNNDYAAYSSALTQAILSCMLSLDTSNIINLMVTANSNRVRSQAATTSTSFTTSTTASTTSSILVAYEVYVHDASQSYASLSLQLNTAVSSGYFTANLQTYGGILGATELENATSTSVTTTNLLASNTGGGRGSSDDLSGGEIAGVVIGSLAGVVLIALLVYCVMMHVYKAGTQTTRDTSPGPELGMSVVNNPIAKKGSTAV